MEGMWLWMELMRLKKEKELVASVSISTVAFRVLSARVPCSTLHEDHPVESPSTRFSQVYDAWLVYIKTRA